MRSNNPRFMIQQILNQRSVRSFDLLRDKQGNPEKISAYFGINTLDPLQMKEKLSREVYEKLMTFVETGQMLDAELGDSVATVIKEWALERGVTHFCHWFQPQTGSTAEKHDAFLSFNDKTLPVEQFSAAQLIKGEPDASSFPSGGMRTTFEARGYTAWDPTSPVFIIENENGKTLCIPTVFISYHGDALDEKAPLLRSMEALEKSAKQLLKTLGMKDVEHIIPTVGAEQEYFLIDRAFYQLRPDLVMTGRTLLGSPPPRGQQLEDHYFGSISPRVLAFMQEVEFELYKLGVPAKTRHNEVAPNQFEMAPIFEDANLAADHNQLIMEVMKRVAIRHDFTVLLHEKPFAGINGSGKHNNWSLCATDRSGKTYNLLDPGSDPAQNMRFLVVLSCVLSAVHNHAGLLRASIAQAGNDHRLGANEAPPAIISVFLGDLLTQVCNKIEAGSGFDQASSENTIMSLGVSKVPSFSRDQTDRNRTSPFAFTGNKFEFRAVGASSAISFPLTVLNTAVAEAMEQMNENFLKKMKGSKKPEAVFLEVLREELTKSHAIRFEGNNYSGEWVKEAESRGLPNLKKAPEAIEQLLSQSAKRLFLSQNVLSERELHSRYHVMLERYVKKMLIEAYTLLQLVDTHVLPALMQQQQLISKGVGKLLTVLPHVEITQQKLGMQKIAGSIESMLQLKANLENSLKEVEEMTDEKNKARLLSQTVADEMLSIRKLSDDLENQTADEFWTLPKYREILFLS